MVYDIETILHQQLNSFHPLPAEVSSEFALLWNEVNFKRKEIITHSGEREQYLYLVLEGVQHAATLIDDKEATLVFSYPYSFSGILDSFLLQQPAGYYLQAITKSKLLRIHYNELMALVQMHPSLETWLWKALSVVLAGTLQRQIELLTLTTEEKFKALLNRSPQVLNLIPHKYLASYIGMDATNFSKMLGKVRL